MIKFTEQQFIDKFVDDELMYGSVWEYEVCPKKILSIIYGMKKVYFMHGITKPEYLSPDLIPALVDALNKEIGTTKSQINDME